MADNRNFVNKFANEGGGDIFVEDAKLSEISTKTAIASEGVMLKGTDGAYYEIDKASLSEVIRAELGAILADNSKNNGTSVGKVPTLNSSGNALGASSVADLASVLGGLPYKGRGDINPDTITEEGKYWDTSGEHAFTGYPCLYIHIQQPSTYVVQYAILTKSNGDVQEMKYRAAYYGTDLSTVSWQRLDNFGCNTPETLASLLGGLMGFTNFSLSVSVSANSSATIPIKNFGLLFIYEYSKTGATGLFLVKGTTLTKIAADGYDIDNSTTFNLSANNSELTIQSIYSGKTSHGYVFIGHS